MHDDGDQDHQDRDVDEGVVQASHQSQHKDKSSWLQTFTLGSVDGVAEDDYYRVEQEQVREVVGNIRQYVVDHNREHTQRDVVVDTNVCVLQRQRQDDSEAAEEEGSDDEDKHLTLDVDDLP